MAVGAGNPREMTVDLIAADLVIARARIAFAVDRVALGRLKAMGGIRGEGIGMLPPVGLRQGDGMIRH
jgi:hypothetical protein